MKINLSITCPSNDIGFVEDKRSFCVEGIINSEETIPENCKLRINIYDSNNDIVRYVESNKKNQDIYRYFDGLTTYSEELDPNRELMSKFGFPLLIVDDLNNPSESINKATIKCWYNDKCFKAIIVNASDIKHGCIADDGFDLLDDDGQPYSLLKKGKYKIEAILSLNNKVLSKTTKDFIIGKKDKQFICRFNPDNHKKAMIKWCDENNISIIKDNLPGYLDPYLGKWYYHMGFLKMYRANDLCLYDDVLTIMFVYLIDPTSTSYETELANLQSRNLLSNKERFIAYHYEIGEAKINERVSNITEFNNNIDLCRIDIVNDKAKENIYYLDNRAVILSLFDLDSINIEYGNTIQVMGVIKPTQMNCDDFILNDDNTYKIKNYPNKIIYTLNNSIKYERYNLMQRFDEESIGNSVYEFYNLIPLTDLLGEVLVHVECFDNYDNSIGETQFRINIKK